MLDRATHQRDLHRLSRQPPWKAAVGSRSAQSGSVQCSANVAGYIKRGGSFWPWALTQTHRWEAVQIGGGGGETLPQADAASAAPAGAASPPPQYRGQPRKRRGGQFGLWGPGR